MKMDEKVPVIIPIVKIRAKSLITPAPKKYRIMDAEKVVILVSMDLDKVQLIARLIIFFRLLPGFKSSSSLMRSKTTIVSLIE